MKPRTRITVFVASVSLSMALSIGNLLTDREFPAWKLTVAIISVTCGVAGIAMTLRDYRRGRWPK
ncbi:hypothetical protein OG785_17900 [Streptomyces sp. NBC_00006]|uniref:hypothetical protein n=1 Tax=unclassified Streptomyces TaxID=2593676 RepID=UPI002253952A|nr:MULTISPECIES: hypothetical protein [unclassified Streptomyces]MCX5532427.1 hypothetical protein [Streptomyces sp. NBC_00006]